MKKIIKSTNPSLFVCEGALLTSSLNESYITSYHIELLLTHLQSRVGCSSVSPRGWMKPKGGFCAGPSWQCLSVIPTPWRKRNEQPGRDLVCLGLGTQTGHLCEGLRHVVTLSPLLWKPDTSCSVSALVIEAKQTAFHLCCLHQNCINSYESMEK